MHRYPTLNLADVYATIAYYLNHCAEVDEYLKESEEIAERLRAENEARFDPQGIRERLLSRLREKQSSSE